MSLPVCAKTGHVGRPSRFLLLGLSLGYFMVLLDTTVVTVALPAIGGDLAGGIAGLQWVSNGYTITFAAFLFTAGRLSDRYGGRRVFLVGAGAFGVLSALSAAASSIGMLVVLRLLLGAAGALLLPTSLAVITTAYPAPARTIGNWAAITGLALVAGPVVGGVLVDLAGWRSIFLVNVPIAIGGLVLTARLAPETVRGKSGTDVLGQGAAIVVLGALVYGLIERDVVAYCVAAGAAMLFLIAERRAGAAALLPLRLFGRTFSAALSGGLLANFGLSAVLFVLSLYFQETLGYEPWAAGLMFLPLTIPTAVNPVFTGRLVGRVGPRIPATIGLVSMAAGALLITATPLLGLFVLGLGVSFALPALVAGVAAAVPKELVGIGAGALNAARQVGASLGVAVLGAVPSATALPVLAGVLGLGALVAVVGL
ncbi:MFS transporter [Actinokineospora enzanensis]|uniref:MFS transporter n=1 Tax=Actinokineospora enzanensis TaxID=155975 RepID=UPI001FE0104C|nr:MFS transporter [Actinokineospora enzanensis]